MKRAFVAIIILILFSGLVSADFYTGNMLLFDLGKKETETCVEYMGAFGYILGVFDAFDNLFWESPSGITSKQVKDIALKYLKEHPEERHRGAIELLKKAFMEAFPKNQE